MTTRASLTPRLCSHPANQEFAAAWLKKRSQACQHHTGKDLRQAECWKLRQRSLGIATAALQNGCHGSLQKPLELAVPGHSMHLWTHWNVVEAILVKNMLKWGRWCEVVMQRSSDFMQLKTYSEGQIYAEKMHTIWVSNNTWKKQEKEEKKDASMLPRNLILADSISNIDCTKMRGRIQLKLAPNNTPQFLLLNELGFGLGFMVAGRQDHLGG